jgi:quinol-cytochrome oxidoreductase complex cytochrome b subunit/mono/diheme cytochrome c family protein
LEDRTGLPSWLDGLRRDAVPGGARWRYVFGFALGAAFLLQLVTGVLLMTAYVPSASQAWGSVWYIQNRMTLGWFLRGMHHFGSSAVVILLLLHLLQVVFTRAYRAPREVNWWLGLGAASCILGLALTGYLLPWDMKGYWATKVATNIAGSTPVVGPAVLSVLLGGSDYGNPTLTRLFGLHVAVLPLSLIVLLLLHLKLRYRHGLAGIEGAPYAETTWPGQVFRNLVAVGLFVTALTCYVVWHHGVTLEAPADPSVPDYPARPEWYFLPLFQLLNYFQSPYEVIGTHVIPGVLFGFLALLPILDWVLPKRLVHGLACLVMGVVVGGVGFLMYVALNADAHNLTFQLARTKADTWRDRSNHLAALQGVPPDGAVYLLRRDPLTRGREVLDQSCLSCHSFAGHGQESRSEIIVTDADLAKGQGSNLAVRAVSGALPEFKATGETRKELRAGAEGTWLTGQGAEGAAMRVWVRSDGRFIESIAESPQTASDLEGFGSRAWVRGLLANPSDSKYFGKTPNLKGMKKWRKDTKLTPEELDQVADFMAKLAEVEPNEAAADWYDRAYDGKLSEHPGATLFVEDCGKCHVIGEAGLVSDGGAMDSPDLFAYGSRRWLEAMIDDPAAEHLYGYLDDADRMPGFASQLSGNDREVLIRFLEGDYPPAFGSVTPAKPAPTRE